MAGYRPERMHEKSTKCSGAKYSGYFRCSKDVSWYKITLEGILYSK